MATRSTTKPKTGKPASQRPKQAVTAKSRAKKAVAAKRAVAPRRAPARRVAAKKVVIGGKTLRSSDAEGYMVYDSPIEPRHFTVEQIRRAVKAVAGR